MTCDGCPATIPASDLAFRREWAVMLVALPSNTVPSVPVCYCPPCATTHTIADAHQHATSRNTGRTP